MSNLRVMPEISDSPAQTAVLKPESSTTVVWSRLGKPSLAFLLLLLGYVLTFSFDQNDAFDSARWMESGEIHRLGEFRHLLQRLLPYWLWLFLGRLGIEVSALRLLNVWDFVTAAASVLVLYHLLVQMTHAPRISFVASAAYATTHCVWIFAGSGRLYSTSMFLVFAAYALALRIGKRNGEGKRYLLATGAGAFVCLASMFWLVHIINAVGVGLLLLLIPERESVLRRLGYGTAYAAAGVLLAGLILVSVLQYLGIPLAPPAIQDWVNEVKTPPMEFNHLSPMKASFGQAHGILVMTELPYLINALMLSDPALLKMASLPWQLGKFIFVWLLLALVYVYPLWMLLRAPSWPLRALILALYAPLTLNMYFALGWLGTDEQRFMPSMLSQFGLGAIACQDLLRRVQRPAFFVAGLVISLTFIAAVNYLEAMRPAQRLNVILAEEMKSLRPVARSGDMFVNFGRDVPSSYPAMITYYIGARYISLSNDVMQWNWDRLDWQAGLDQFVRREWAHGAQVFVIDRLATGSNPPEAGWSELQHPRPTLRQFSEQLGAGYCVTPAFSVHKFRYFRLTPKADPCPAHGVSQPVEGRK